MADALTARLARQASGMTRPGLDFTDRGEATLANLPLALLDPDPNQPRKDLGALADLAHSIIEHGLLQPILVEALPNQRYRIVAGERRYAACRSLGWAEMPCLVRPVDDPSRLAVQLVENIHRQDLHPIEEARAMQRLMDECGLSQRDLAKRLGRSLGAINQALRVLSLPESELTEARSIEGTNKSVILEIAKVPEASARQELWNQARTGALTVRQARAPRIRRPDSKCPTSPTESSAPSSTVLTSESSHRLASSPPEPTAAPPALRRLSVETEEAVVEVLFRHGEASLPRVRAALEEALRRLPSPG